MVSIFAGTKGYLDNLPVADVRRFESELLAFMRSRHGAMLNDIRTKGLPDDLGSVVQSFKDSFMASAEAARKANEAASDAEQIGDAKSNKTLATE